MCLGLGRVRRCGSSSVVVRRIAGIVAKVAELLARVVAGVADLVGEVFLAVALAPGLLGGLFGFAVALLDVVHGLDLLVGWVAWTAPVSRT